MRRYGIVAVSLLCMLFAGPALADCDSDYGPQVQRQGGGDTLVICSPGGGFDFRGYPTKMNITGEGTASDSITITFQSQQDDSDNLDAQTMFRVVVSDTSFAAGGVASSAPDTGVTIAGDGAILNEPVADKIIDLQTDADGTAQLHVQDNTDQSFWLHVLMPTGEVIVSDELDFD